MRAAATALTALALAACFGADADTGAGIEPEPSGAVSGYCAGARLAASSAAPLDELALEGLDPARAERPVDELFGLYAPSGSAERLPVPLVLGGDGASARLVVPPHPGGTGGGGGRLRLTDGRGLSCPELELAIAAIPAAPGTTARVAERLAESIAATARLLGLEPERLREPRGLPVEAIGLALAQWALDGPDNPHSLRAELARGGELALLDALYARAGVLDALEHETAERAALATVAVRPAAPLPRVAVARGNSPWSGLATLALLGARPAFARSSPVLHIRPPAIPDAATLSRMMSRQAAAASTLGGATGKLLGDAGTAIEVVGIWAPGVGAAAGTMLFVHVKSNEAIRQLWPCCFASLEYELDRPYFLEDDEVPPDPSWREVRVVVHNLGWNLTQTAIESAFATVGAGKGFKGAWENHATRKAGGQLTYDVVGGLEETGAHGWLQKNVQPELDRLTVPPYTWPPVALTPGPQWNEADAEGAIRTISLQNYRPVAVGPGKLTVGTLPGKFGRASKALAKLVPVREISVSVTPKVKRVEPGDTVELRAFVRDSAHPELLEWKFTTARGAELRSYTSRHAGDGEHVAKLALPRDESIFPVEAEAESTSRTGLRASGSPRRFGAATLTAGVVVEAGPQPACIERGDPALRMWAEVVGAADARVDWRVTSGPARVDRRTGELTATGRGQATVRATSVADPRAWDEATVEVGTCTCTLSGTISGDTSAGPVRGEVAHFSTKGGATILGAFTNPEALAGAAEAFGGLDAGARQTAREWQREAAAGPRETLGISLVGAEVEGEALLAAMAGGFKLQASVVDHPIEPGFAGGLPLGHLVVVPGDWTEDLGQQVRYEWAPGAPGSASLTVTQYTGNSLQGTLAGTLEGQGVYKEGGQRPRISFVVHFRALEFDPLNQKLGCVVSP